MKNLLVITALLFFTQTTLGDINMADAGTGSGDGRMALSYAEEKNHADITEVLKQAGAK